MKSLGGIIFCGLIILVFSASAFSTDQSKVLGEIAKFAEQLCQTAPIKSHSNELQLSGKANTELKGLLSKIASLGVTGAAEYKKSESEGVLQKDLANLLSRSTDCKQKIAEKLIDKLITNATPEVSNTSVNYMEQSQYEGTDCRIVTADGLRVNFKPVEEKGVYQDWRTWGWARYAYQQATIENASEVIVYEVRPEEGYWDIWRYEVKSNSTLLGATLPGSPQLTFGSCWKPAREQYTSVLARGVSKVGAYVLMR